jgi:predicted GIY-YIG superfamily endonuclease
MASKSRVLYTGITNNLQRRVWEHKHDELAPLHEQVPHTSARLL